MITEEVAERFLNVNVMLRYCSSRFLQVIGLCCVFANMNLATALKISAQNGIMKFGELPIFLFF